VSIYHWYIKWVLDRVHYKVIAHDFARDTSLGKMENLLFDIRRCRVLISILSEELAYSEIINSLLMHAFNNKVRILPIRVNYSGELFHSLNHFIPNERIIFWKNQSDTSSVIGEINNAITGRPYGQNTIEYWSQDKNNNLPRPYPAANVGADGILLEQPTGTMNPESKFYVLRNEDIILNNEIKQDRFIVTIKGPRQMGKSSMLVQAGAKIEKTKKTVIYVDFQRFGKSMINDANRFYKSFCELLADKLNISINVEQYWATPRFGYLMRFSNFVEKYVLPQIEAQLILTMDEVDLMIDTKERSDFFGLLRSWHNDRSSIWRKLNMILVVSTEPFLLIDNLSQSPFNVGTILSLGDFNVAQIERLNQLHNYPFTEDEVRVLMEWIGGHPYLARQALYMASTGSYSSKNFINNISRKDGPYSDHLTRHLLNLAQNLELATAMKRLVNSKIKPSEMESYRLESAGLIRLDNGIIIPRNRLYEVFLKENLQ